MSSSAEPSGPVYLSDLTDDELSNRDIKAAFFDIDGTLLGLDGHYDPGLVEQIQGLKSAGIKTGIASGRPQFAAQFVIDELGLDDPGIFCAGAHVYFPAEARSLRSACLQRDDSKALIAALRKLIVYYELYTEDEFYVEPGSTSFEAHKKIRDTHAEHLRRAPKLRHFDEPLSSSSVIKILAAVDNRQDQDVLFRLERDFPQLDFAFAGIAAYPDWLFVSVVDSQACRKQAFELLLDYHGIEAHQVISFGDAQSDCVLLSSAGIGVAMGNATQQVKDIANYVTKPVWENGVSYALSRFIKV